MSIGKKSNHTLNTTKLAESGIGDLTTVSLSFQHN